MMDDSIKRQDAIDALWKALYDYEDKKEKQFLESEELNTDDWYRHRIFVQNMSDIDRQTILNLPSAQQWIPCSERLPPELKPVNVTWINRQPPTYYEKIKDKPFTDTAVYYEGKWYWQSVLCVDLLKEYGESPADDVAHEIEIVAWMPLPEPYKGENDELDTM